MNILTDNLPKSVQINSKHYPIYTDFKRWLKIDALISDRNTEMKESIAKILLLCYKELPENIADAMKGVSFFYLCGRENTKNVRKKEKSKTFSFTDDAGLIYAAFFSQYGIDLTKERLHWFKFMAIFEALSDEHKFSKVVSLRSLNPHDIKDAKRKKALYELKRYYALTDMRTEEEKSDDIAKNMASLF
ncbi:MAG: hypothetical protein IKB60_05660 [Clostridia bacterium]|nr:hypothetical protein [Clostridia bacterium]